MTIKYHILNAIVVVRQVTTQTSVVVPYYQTIIHVLEIPLATEKSDPLPLNGNTKNGKDFVSITKTIIILKIIRNVCLTKKKKTNKFTNSNNVNNEPIGTSYANRIEDEINQNQVRVRSRNSTKNTLCVHRTTF